MANKRVSELAPITSTQLVVGDLLLLSDIVAQESKKLTIQEFSTWLFNGSLNTIAVSLTGSLFGTSSWARFSQTASVVTNPSASYALTASFALNGTSGAASVSSSWASQSLSASFATTASYVNLTNATSASFATNATNAKSASFVIFTGGNNGTVYNAVLATNSTNSILATTATTATTATSSLSATSALSASFSSQSLSSSHAIVADFAFSASIGITTNFQSSASWASQSLSSSNSLTASYALTALQLVPSTILYPQGVYLAITQSTLAGQLDVVQINPSLASPVSTSIEAMGTVIAFYTSSIILNESISLYALDRTTGTVVQLDSTPIYVNIQGQFGSISASINAIASGSITGGISGSINGRITGSISGSLTGSISGSLTGGFTGSISGSNANGTLTGSLTSSINASVTASLTASISASVTASLVATYAGTFSGSVSGSISTALSGAIKIPFSLMGSTPMTGTYLVYVSASSNNINLEPTRTTRFNIDSAAGNFGVSSGEPIQFTDTPTNTVLTFTSTDGGPFTDTAANIVATGSSKILTLSASALGITNMKYVWTLNNLTSFNANDNASLGIVGGMPASIVTMSCMNCSLAVLSPLNRTSASILKVHGNQLVALPSLPSTMSYIDCSGNFGITSLPDPLPYGLTTLLANTLNLTSVPSSFTNTLLTMSFANNSGLSLWLTTLPTALTYFDVNHTSLTQIPTVPANVLFLDVSSCQFGSIALDNVCAQLVSNGFNSGSLNISSNPGPILNPTTTNRIATLVSRGWTVTT
jgi:hypothetical protein